MSEKIPVTKTLPDESTAIPTVPPSALLPSPVLSIISVMIPPGVILKALFDKAPATKTLPDESTAISPGRLSALLPSPVLSIISVTKKFAYAF